MKLSIQRPDGLVNIHIYTPDSLLGVRQLAQGCYHYRLYVYIVQVHVIGLQ